MIQIIRGFFGSGVKASIKASALSGLGRPWDFRDCLSSSCIWPLLVKVYLRDASSLISSESSLIAMSLVWNRSRRWLKYSARRLRKFLGSRAR